MRNINKRYFHFQRLKNISENFFRTGLEWMKSKIVPNREMNKGKEKKKRDARESLRNYRKRFMLSLFLSLASTYHGIPFGTSMLSDDKVLFFTKPPSVAQAWPIRRQWIVNSSQSERKPRRDRDHGAILLMNYLNGWNNKVSFSFSSPF